MIVSLMFSIFFRWVPSIYLIVMAVMITALLTGLILLYFAGNKVSRSSMDTETANIMFKKLEYKIQLIYSSNKGHEYSATICKLLDAIKACDQSCYVTADDRISDGLDQLSLKLQEPDINTNDVNDLSSQILKLIHQRSLDVNNLKIGGI